MECTGVIIVAGGSGSRAGGARPKQFRFLGGMPVLARTINTFAAALPGAEIVPPLTVMSPLKMPTRPAENMPMVRAKNTFMPHRASTSTSR